MIMEERDGRESRPFTIARLFSPLRTNDVVDLPDDVPSVTGLSIFFLLSSIIMHLVDMCFDYNLAIRYLLHRKIIYFLFTISLILFPSLVNVLVSLRMEYRDREFDSAVDTLDPYRATRFVFRNKFYYVLAVVLQLAPVLRYWDTLRYAIRARRCENTGNRSDMRRYYLMMLREDQDVALLRIFECFLEAAPQQILQLALMLKHYRNDVDFEFAHQMASIVSSLVGMAWAMASYHRSIRLAQTDKSNIGVVGTILQFLWHFFITVTRILSLTIVASVWPLYTIACCVAHWIGATIWILLESHGILQFCRDYHRPPHALPTPKERLYSLLFAAVIGIVHIFIYLNPVDSDTFWKQTSFYVLCFLENATSNVLWRYASSQITHVWYFHVIPIVCIISFLFGIFAIILYYAVFHPKKKRQPNSKVTLPTT